MKKLCLILAMASMLGGCAGMAGVNSAGNLICDHEFEARIGLEAAQIRALSIEDEVRREAVLAAIRISLAALDACPIRGDH